MKGSGGSIVLAASPNKLVRRGRKAVEETERVILMPNKKKIIRRPCSKCGSTENVQRHHVIPGDDYSVIPLCGDCHSKEHPGVPDDIFNGHNYKPYWKNDSIGAIARGLGVDRRTISRAVKRLRIPRGELSPQHKELISNSIHPQKRRNDRIKAAYDSIPGWTLKALANMFKVSISTVHYAIRGRPTKKTK